jgi:hypothetical protein
MKACIWWCRIYFLLDHNQGVWMGLLWGNILTEYNLLQYHLKMELQKFHKVSGTQSYSVQVTWSSVQSNLSHWCWTVRRTQTHALLELSTALWSQFRIVWVDIFNPNRSGGRCVRKMLLRRDGIPPEDLKMVWTLWWAKSTLLKVLAPLTLVTNTWEGVLLGPTVCKYFSQHQTREDPSYNRSSTPPRVS